MTVHQAKGLEFDAVVLPELDVALTRPSGHCVADVGELGEPPEAITRYLSSKSWHFLPQNWQRAFGAQAAGAMTESLCLLYVAMTRARQALHIVIQPPKKRDFESRTAASLIYHALGCEADPTEGSITLCESAIRSGTAARLSKKSKSEKSLLLRPNKRQFSFVVPAQSRAETKSSQNYLDSKNTARRRHSYLDSPLQKLGTYEHAPVERIRGASRRALENMVQLAIDESVDLVVIAGDLYDGDWPDQNTGLCFVAQANKLVRAGIPIVVIRGNHDAANLMTSSLPLPPIPTGAKS